MSILSTDLRSLFSADVLESVKNILKKDKLTDGGTTPVNTHPSLKKVNEEDVEETKTVEEHEKPTSLDQLFTDNDVNHLKSILGDEYETIFPSKK